MTLIQIKLINGEPMGRPVNENPKFDPISQRENIGWKLFEQSVTYHPAPGCEESDGVEGELIWQVNRKKYMGVVDSSDLFSAKIIFEDDWAECAKEHIDVLNSEKVIKSMGKFETRQIWVTPSQKVEVKEVENNENILKLKTVWTLQCGMFEDVWIVGVFSSEDAAKEALKLTTCHTHTIEKFEIDVI